MVVPSIRAVLLAATVATVMPLVAVAGLEDGGGSLTLATERSADATTSTTRPVATSTTATTTTTPATTAAPTTTPTTIAPTTTTEAAPPPPPTTSPPPPPTTHAPSTTQAPPSTQAPPARSEASTSSCTGEFTSWINQARANHGVPALSADGGIAHIPTDWSRSMAERQHLAHNPSYGDKIQRERPQATSWSENVGYADNGRRAVFDAFMNSSGHRSNILDGSKTHATAGCSVDANGRSWVALDFWG